MAYFIKPIEISEDVARELQFSDEYAEYLSEQSNLMICNGDQLTYAMEDGYMFEEFLESLGFCAKEDDNA